ncbi:anthranilate phosphoribosyltransferase [bacterium]|jgi:anthranilate phosphoribosyltransferase|nr:anthranilate phosphoribosyltransferase [bacterium]
MSPLDPFLDLLRKGATLSESESTRCLTTIFTQSCSEKSIIELLDQLQQRGETVEELVGFSRAMRANWIPVPNSSHAIDICGTGGSGKIRFNVSTATAFVLASLNVPVAKHGNRGSKAPNGSFDFLEALDVPFQHTPDTLIQLLEDTHLCFIFARQHHPAVKSVAQARQTLQKRTIFNKIGPLSNPASVDYQIIGTPSLEDGRRLAKAAQTLGTTCTWVIVGANGLDELSTTGESHILKVTPGSIIEDRVSPEALGLPLRSESDIVGGTAKENAALFKTLIKTNQIDHPISELIRLNTAAALTCSGHTDSIQDGLKRAKNAIESGAVWNFFLHYQAAAKKAVTTL